MNRTIIETSDFLGPRRHWTKIAFDVERLAGPVAYRILNLARNQHWQLISTVSFSGHLPLDMEIQGALTGRLPTEPEVRGLVQRDIPVVRIGRWPHPDDSLVPAVLEDRSAYGRLAAEHFAQRNFKHVAFVGQKDWQLDKVLYEGFAERARELDCQCHLLQLDTLKHLQQAGNSRDRWEFREKLVTQWLDSLPLPVGLVASGDAIADRYCHWILKANLRVPEDVAVLGIGNRQLVCEPAVIPLSSIAPDHVGIVKSAVDMLACMLDGQAPETNPVRVPPMGIFTRRSTDILGARNPRVVCALQLIWRHLNEDLSVDWIADQVGVSRRTLERAFELDLGRGVYQEIQRRRLETARGLLLRTNQRIGDIADALNFSSHQYFCQAFRTAYGMSPAKYRRQLP